MTNSKYVNGGSDEKKNHDPYAPTPAEIEQEERLRRMYPVNRNELGGICRRCAAGESDGTNIPDYEMCARCIQEVKEQQNPGSTTNRGGKRKKTSRKHKKKKHTRKHKKKSIKKKHKKMSIKKKNTRKR